MNILLATVLSSGRRFGSLRLLAIVGLLTGSSVVASAAGKFEPPVPLQTVAPVHPVESLRSGIPGTAILEFWVDADGTAHDAKIVSTTDWAFARPALDAIMKWKFKPAQLDGVAIATRATMPFNFMFEDGDLGSPIKRWHKTWASNQPKLPK